MLRIQISSTEELLSADRKILENKLKVLERLVKRYGEEVLLSVNIKPVTSRETGNVLVAEARLVIPGNDIRCSIEASSIKEVATQLKNNLKRLIIENKEKHEDKWKRLSKKVHK
ncbi:MAG: hypothetical protein PHD96_02370 [Candidatus Pacebacteria bacterium]|nr:hypothetical protein [Candidatus Paceibacterota bacterium]